MNNQCRDQNRLVVVLVGSRAKLKPNFYLFAIESDSSKAMQKKSQIAYLFGSMNQPILRKKKIIEFNLTGISSIVLSEIHIYNFLVVIF